LLALFFDIDDGSNMLLRNAGLLFNELHVVISFHNIIFLRAVIGLIAGNDNDLK
jgi:hypothetical protein